MRAALAFALCVVTPAHSADPFVDALKSSFDDSSPAAVGSDDRFLRIWSGLGAVLKSQRADVEVFTTPGAAVAGGKSARLVVPPPSFAWNVVANTAAKLILYYQTHATPPVRPCTLDDVQTCCERYPSVDCLDAYPEDPAFGNINFFATLADLLAMELSKNSLLLGTQQLRDKQLPGESAWLVWRYSPTGPGTRFFLFTRITPELVDRLVFVTDALLPKALAMTSRRVGPSTRYACPESAGQSAPISTPLHLSSNGPLADVRSTSAEKAVTLLVEPRDGGLTYQATRGLVNDVCCQGFVREAANSLQQCFGKAFGTELSEQQSRDLLSLLSDREVLRFAIGILYLLGAWDDFTQATPN